MFFNPYAVPLIAACLIMLALYRAKDKGRNCTEVKQL